LLRLGAATAEFGLSLVIGVVNFATERWQERHRRLAAKYGNNFTGRTSVIVPSVDGWKKFPGDYNVFGWPGDGNLHPAVIASMLMAVEKWFYDESDAARPLDHWVERILSEGRSAALIGVLVLL